MNKTTQKFTPLQLSEMGKEVSLQNVKSQCLRMDNWEDWEYYLTDQDRQQIADLLGGRISTREIVRSRLRFLPELPSFWAFDRIIFCKHSKRWTYTAGQDYPGELAMIRKYFLNL
jgi:hypothetical protein